MVEKYRVMQARCFMVEFMLEENRENFEYIHKVKELVVKAGFKYYYKVDWKKDKCVANTCRKAENT